MESRLIYGWLCSELATWLTSSRLAEHMPVREPAQAFGWGQQPAENLASQSSLVALAKGLHKAGK